MTNPFGGQFRVEKKESEGAAPKYELTAPNWVTYKRSSDGLVYLFQFKGTQGDWIPLAPQSRNSALTTALPDTSHVRVSVRDDLGGLSHSEVSLSGLENKNTSYSHYSSGLQEIVNNVFDQTAPEQELRQLLVWSAGLDTASKNLESQQVTQLSSQALSALSICLKKLQQ